MGEEEGSFRGSGLSPWGSEVGLPCSSTNVSAMHAIPAGDSPRQPPSAQHWVHPYKSLSAACHPAPGTVVSPFGLHSATWQAGPTGGDAARGAEASCAHGEPG